MKRFYRISVWGFIACVLGGSLWLGWPVYHFFAHKGQAPMPAWDYLTLPEQAPSHQTLDDSRYRESAERAQQTIAEHRTAIRAPALSAAVAIEGKRVWAGAVGWADIEKDLAVTPRTRFRIGSTSKPLTITALAKLVTEGTIDLDTSIARYMPNLPNPQWQDITPRHLASHTSGLVDYKHTAEWSGLYRIMALRTDYPNVRDSLEIFDNSPLAFVPGNDFQYTTYSTVLLSAVMQAAADKSFQKLMHNFVFAPLQMTYTSPEPSSPEPNIARFYWMQGDRARPWRKVNLSHRLAGGGFISTPSDLVKLGSAWLNEDFLPTETRRRFWQPQRLANGDVNPQNYALGWRRHEGDDYMVTQFNHGGVSRGAQCYLMVIPEYQMAVAVSINRKTEEFWDFGEVAVLIARQFMAARDA